MNDITNYFRYAMLFPIVVTIIISIIIIPLVTNKNYKIVYEDNVTGSKNLVESTFLWPTPKFRNISSSFGKRNSPTAGASSYHQGVDILAYQGSSVICIADGIVTFAGWDRSGGYMVKIKHSNVTESAYCHLSEKIFVGKGDKINKGMIIGTVGPKVLSNGKLNGATTRCSFTFCHL